MSSRAGSDDWIQVEQDSRPDERTAKEENGYEGQREPALVEIQPTGYTLWFTAGC